MAYIQIMDASNGEIRIIKTMYSANDQRNVDLADEIKNSDSEYIITNEVKIITSTVRKEKECLK